MDEVPSSIAFDGDDLILKRGSQDRPGPFLRGSYERYQNIVCVDGYDKFSAEEIRLRDYMLLALG